MRNTFLAGLLLASISAPALAAEPAYNLAEARAKIAKIEMRPDTSYLSAEEKQVVNLLIQAAEKMSDIYLRQNYAANPQVRRAISVSRRADQAQLLDMFDLYFGPWDELADGHPFWGTKSKPAGAGFYPEDLTKDQFDAYLAAHPDEKAALTSPYTVVRRDGSKLVAVPYSKAYAEFLEPAAKLLDQAAAITTNASLRKSSCCAPRRSAPTIITSRNWRGWI